MRTSEKSSTGWGPLSSMVGCHATVRLIALIGALVVVALFSHSTVINAADMPAETEGVFLLGESKFSGTLVSYQDNEEASAPILTWNCPLFLDPLRFQIAGEAWFDFAESAVVDEEPFHVTLANGDVISGEIDSLDAEHLQLNSKRHGRVRVPIAAMRDAQRKRDIYSGPTGLKGWEVVEGKKRSWRSNDDGELFCNAADSSIFLPIDFADCEVTIVLESKTAPPQFTLGLARNGVEGAVVTTYGPESLVLSYDSGAIPDKQLAEVDGDEREHYLRIRWQKRKRRFSVTDKNFHSLGELELPEKAANDSSPTGIFLANQGKDLKLSRLRVSHLYLDEAESEDKGAYEIVLRDGRRLSGTDVRSVGDQLTVRTNEQDEKFRLADIIAIGFGSKDDAVANASTTNRQMTAVWANGDAVTGKPIQLRDGTIQVESAFVGRVASDITGLATLHWHAVKKLSPGSDQLKSEVTERLSGTIMLGDERSAILWKQDQTIDAVRIDPAMRATIVRAVWDTSDRRVYPEKLFLENGDVIFCRLLRANDEAFEIDHPFGNKQPIAFEQVRALELQAAARSPKNETINRLLTVPRFRADDPFRHALIAKNGDVLRGHLVSISDDSVRFESQGEELRFDRELIATIVCLPAIQESDEADDDQSEEDIDQPTAATNDTHAIVSPRVQVRLTGEMAITMNVSDSRDQQLKGRSPIIGECAVAIDDVDEIRFAPSGIRHRYLIWEPLVADEPRWEAQSAAPKDAAKLVGTEAEEFELAELGATPFRLSEHRGKVVVLDFWATWCGPCVRALPEYMNAISDIDSDDVVFVAVNISDTPKAIREFLEAKEMESLRVLLDHRQLVASAFGVTGIPHTVVIGRDGVIEDVHVGYSRSAAEELKRTVRELLR